MNTQTKCSECINNIIIITVCKVSKSGVAEQGTPVSKVMNQNPFQPYTLHYQKKQQIMQRKWLLSEAIQWTLKHQKGNQPNPPAPNTTYHIYTDSISSLHSMRNPLKSDASDYLIACIHMIASSSHNIQMKYIPAHKGYKRNEIADSLAKEGVDNSHTLESSEPITDLRNQNL